MIFPIDEDHRAKELRNLPSAAENGKGVAGSARSSALGHTDSRAAELPNFAGAVPFSVNRFTVFSESEGYIAMNFVNPRAIFEFLR